MSQDFQAICQLIDDGVKNISHLSVLADWLEERGDERAAGLRWLVSHKKAPSRRSGIAWDWYCSNEIRKDARDILPLNSHVQREPLGWYRPHATLSAAFLAAAADLVQQHVAE